jgi:hypothetical protein
MRYNGPVDDEGNATDAVAWQAYMDEVNAFHAALDAAYLEQLEVKNAVNTALALVELLPSLSAEQAALATAQIADALNQYATLIDPPADLVSAVSALVAWKLAQE